MSNEQLLIGMCKTCQYVKLIRSSRGSVFLMCGLAKTDPQFAKYPQLPVLSCDGYRQQEDVVESDAA